MVKRNTITASTLRAQSDTVKARIATELRDKVWPLISEGCFRPIVDTTFDFSDAAQAHQRLESSKHIGKLILNVTKK